MRGGSNKNGYTIIEVLLFLAISSLMFVLANGFISGKQSNAQFRQGVHELNSQIQQTISDVSNGYYPHSDSFKCDADSVPLIQPEPSSSGGTATLGGNQGCVFTGKIIQFLPLVDGAADKAKYKTLTVVGRQYTSDLLSLPPDTYQSSAIIAYDIDAPSLIDTKAINWGVDVDGVRYNNDSSIESNAIGIFSSPAGRETASVLDSGGQSVSVVPFLGFGAGKNDADVNAKLISLRDSSPPNNLDTQASRTHNITICMSNGNDRFARIIIGGEDDQRLASRIKFTNKPTGTDVCA